jgi:hypothetical protein
MDRDFFNTFASLTYRNEQTERKHSGPQQGTERHENESVPLFALAGLTSLMMLAIWAILAVI